MKVKKIVLFSLALVMAGQISAQVCFTPHTEYPVGTNPTGVVTGDFNNDNFQDIVVTNSGDNNISVFLGNGSGTFGTPTTYTTTMGPQGICKGYFNGDAFLDLGFTNFGGSMMNVMLNDGTGGFGAVTSYFPPGGPQCLTPGDFNNDGFIDIVTANYSSANVTLYLGTGTGTFGTGTNFNVGTNPLGIINIDLNADGNLDVVTANYGSNNMSVLIGTGTGSFAARVNYVTGGTAPGGLVAADFDGDGDNDIVIGNANSNNISLLLNDGTGVFSAGTQFNSNMNSLGAITTGDFNSDGFPDIGIGANNIATPVAKIYVGNGAGSFSPYLDFPISSGARGAANADFNNDGKLDFVTCNISSNEISVLLNTALPVVHASASDTVICAGAQVTLTGIGAASTSYSWSPFPVANGVAFTPSGTTTYTVTGTLNGCVDTDTLTVFIAPPSPVVAHANQTLVCAGTPVTFTGSGAVSYTWTAGVVNGVPHPVNFTHTYTVTGTNAFGCNSNASITITVYTPPTPQICRVTVDSVSLNNIIYWDKTLYPMADSFFVYRDTANNAYGLIGKLPYSALSEFKDSLRLLYLANGDPNASSWRYKIALKDTCGTLSPKSPYHQSIFMQNNTGNFTWSEYRIEGQGTPVSGLTNYVFKRDNLSDGNYAIIQVLSASSTFYSDLNYSTYIGTGTWRVETTWTTSCVSSMRINGVDQIFGPINTSRSNIKSPTSIGIKEIGDAPAIKVYPVPASESISVETMDVKGESTITIKNALGQMVFELRTSLSKNTIPVTNFDTGVYFVSVITTSGTITEKILVKRP